MGHLNVEKQTVFCHVMGDYIIVIMYFILNVKKKGNCQSTEKSKRKKDNKGLCYQESKKQEKREK